MSTLQTRQIEYDAMSPPETTPEQAEWNYVVGDFDVPQAAIRGLRSTLTNFPQLADRQPTPREVGVLVGHIDELITQLQELIAELQ